MNSIVPKLTGIDKKCFNEQLQMDIKGEGINSWLIKALVWAVIMNEVSPIITWSIIQAFDEVRS